MFALNADVRAQEKGLIHHWPLAGNAKDVAGESHGNSAGVDFDVAGPAGKAKTAARFDGRKSMIEVPSGKSLKLGEEDFTLAVWVHTEQELDDAIGDILSKFDAQGRRGFNWCIKNGAGTVGSQSNYRNVQFGIDAGSDPKWTDCGRPGTNVFPMAMATHDGKLFAGVCEPGANDAGRVYQYGGGKDWIDCGSPDGSNAVTNLISHGGKLYAGTGNYRLRGSLLPESENTQPGGKVFCYAGDGKWTDCGRVGEMAALGGLVTYKGELYATPMYGPGVLFRYAGGQQWSECPLPSPPRRIASPAVFNGELYCVTFDGCEIYRFDGKSWSGPFMLESRGQTYAFDIHAGELFASTWPNGKVYRSADGKNWKDAGRSGDQLEVMGMAVYNGKLYGGTLPLAEVYRYDGDDRWVNTGRLDLTPDVRYRRAWSMAVYDGKLFCGVLPSGHVHALEAGVNATYDHELKPGWRHLAAVRSGNRLQLYVDGKRVAESKIPNYPTFNLDNDQPLKIGFGGHDYFNGCLSDLRIYNRALTPEHITAFAAKDPGAKSSLPVVALVGDSIRMGYGPAVAELLRDRAIVVSDAHLGSDSASLLSKLDELVISHRPSVVHFNCGLHDLRILKGTGQHQVPIEQYEDNLRQIVHRLQKETKARIVFATTTPIRDEQHAKHRSSYQRHEADVRQYNQVAKRVMREAGVEIDDLHAVVVELGVDKLQRADGIHYSEMGSQALAKSVAASIQKESFDSPAVEQR